MKLNVKFKETSAAYNVVLSESASSFPALFGQTVLPERYYSGEYTITPKVVGQMFETKSKYLVQNIVVEAIPIYEVSNAQGGKTTIIGG